MPSLPENKTKWLSGHIFFHHDIYSEAGDQIILAVAAPFIKTCLENQWIDGYFFIRYVTEEGPHIRLRLHGPSSTLDEMVQPALQAKVESFNTPTMPALSLRWIPYEPEVNRYGGEAGVQLAETFFQYSSEITCILIEDIATSGQTTRLGKALLLMTILTYTFLPDRTQAAAFLRDYSSGYLRTRVRDETLQANWIQAFNRGYSKQSEKLGMYVNEVWHRLETADSLSPTLDHYHRHMIDIKEQFATLVANEALIKNDTLLADWQSAVWSIVSSYIHMMNNRLGVRIEDEAYLAFLMMQTLDKSIDYELS